MKWLAQSGALLVFLLLKVNSECPEDDVVISPGPHLGDIVVDTANTFKLVDSGDSNKDGIHIVAGCSDGINDDVSLTIVNDGLSTIDSQYFEIVDNPEKKQDKLIQLTGNYEQEPDFPFINAIFEVQVNQTRPFY